MSTSSGTDSLLATLNYTLLVLNTTSRHLTHISRQSVAARTPPRINLSALTRLISDYRIFVRLWGLLSIYTWARSTPPDDTTLQRITYVQVAASAAFQALENGAYLAQHGVLVRGWSEERQAKAWVWSSRAWAVHVALDLVRLWRVRTIRLDEATALAKVADSQEPEGSHQIQAEVVGGDGQLEKAKNTQQELLEKQQEEEERAWWREVIVNAAYAPLTLHWSVERGIFGDGVVGLLGSTAGVIRLMQVWKATA
ncbi:MAG: hypothetical protein M1825_002740 [Sarcosagium campestre]|nr:MAG: hypothetical protein M1825_002740 [Sarcosagium campestre]